MAEYNRRIHSEIMRIREDGLQSAESVIDTEVQRLCNDFDAGELLNTGETCLNQVRDIRRLALGKYQQLKRDIDEAVIDQIGRMNENDGIKRLREKKKELDEAIIQRDNAEHVREAIKSNNRGMTVYKRYQSYHKPLNKGKAGRGIRSDGQEEDTLSEEYLYAGVYDAVNGTEEEYKYNYRRSILIGAVATILFAATDFYLLRSLFIASNMSSLSAIVTALISAFILDAPPVILGFLISKRIDIVRIWYLRDDPDDPGRVKQNRIFTFMSVIMVAAIAVAFIAYFLLRILLFLGGGDFNVVMHSILEHNFTINPSDLQKVQYNGAELISAVVPLVTSVSAFAVGIALSTSKADYIKKAVAVIDQELNNCVTICDRKRNEYNTIADRLKEELETLRKEVYTYYVIRGAVNDTDVPNIPDNDNDKFIHNVVLAGREIEMASCLPIYVATLARLRQRAEDKLIGINRELAAHVAIPKELAGMKYSGYERESLDEIWVKDEGAIQKADTKETIDMIKDLTSIMM